MNLIQGEHWNPCDHLDSIQITNKPHLNFLSAMQLLLFPQTPVCSLVPRLLPRFFFYTMRQKAGEEPGNEAIQFVLFVYWRAVVWYWLKCSSQWVNERVCN